MRCGASGPDGRTQSSLARHLAPHRSVRGNYALGGDVTGVGAPLVDLHQSRFDQLKPGKEPGHLIPAAQRLRRVPPSQ
jgi:hypothetical protein